MAPWNKPTQPPSQEFLQNEERRKQLIIEAARRRKEKEIKRHEQEEQARRSGEAALSKHKQEKKDAYIKYLKGSGGANMHDKYEDIRRKKKAEQVEIKPTAKWRKRNEDKYIDEEEIDIKLKSGIGSAVSAQKSNASDGGGEKRRVMEEEFKRDWQDEMGLDQQLLSSQLLDSLDLDVGTLGRQLQVKQLKKQMKKEQEPLKPPKSQEQLQLRDLIGYESQVMNQDNAKIESHKSHKTIDPPAPKSKQKQVNQVQAFNELKHKKEAKVFHWAIEEEQQADQLFSNCSSKNKKPVSKALQQINSELKNQHKNRRINKNNHLGTIKEEEKRVGSRQRQQQMRAGIQARGSSRDKSTEVERKRSVDAKPNTSCPGGFKKKAAMGQSKPEPPKTTTGFGQPAIRVRSNSREVKTVHRQHRSVSKDKKEATGFSKKQTAYSSRPDTKWHSSNQALPPRSEPVAAVKEQPPKKLFGKMPPLPKQLPNNNSIATHDMQIDVESFIRNDLVNLNEQERQLQMELRDLYKATKNTIKDTYEKHQIRIDYGHSQEITGITSGHEAKYNPSENDIEESLVNLDNYLIRKEQEKDAVKEDENEESRSLIDPFSNSEVLCNQVLQLAKNVSRFDKPPEEELQGYGQQKRRKQSGGKAQRSSVSKGSRDSRQKYVEEVRDSHICESQQVSQIPLPQPPSILGSSPDEKIHINEKFRGLLFD